LTDPDHLKSAAEYLLQVARRSEGRRYRKQPKIDALRQYKEEILEAHRSGLSVHRIAQIFRERGVDISVPHLVRTIRRFVDEEERAGGKSSTAQQPSATKERRQELAAAEETKPKAPVTYQVSERPSTRVQEEEICEAIAACSLPGRGRLAAIAATRGGSSAKSA
jgi:IS30 family transposase